MGEILMSLLAIYFVSRTLLNFFVEWILFFIPVQYLVWIFYLLGNVLIIVGLIKEKTIEKLHELHRISSLYITKEPIKEAMDAVNNFKINL